MLSLMWGHSPKLEVLGPQSKSPVIPNHSLQIKYLRGPALNSEDYSTSLCDWPILIDGWSSSNNSKKYDSQKRNLGHFYELLKDYCSSHSPNALPH